jgi:hypothetical protein
MEVWTLNEAYNLLKQINVPVTRISRWFEIHDPNSPSKNTPEHINFLKNCPVPLIMQKENAEFPNSIAYPREEVKAMLNENFIIDEVGCEFREWSNSISGLIALAILEGYEEIHVTGVDMAQSQEYAFQRSSATALILFAAGKGIKVLIPRTSELCKFPQDYGFETDNAVRHKKKARKKELKARMNNFLAEINKAQAAIKQYEISVAQIQGAISEIDYDLNNHIV